MESNMESQIKEEFKKCDYNDFTWICEYCKDVSDKPYELAKVSFRTGYAYIPGNKMKIINIKNDGRILMVCPRCYAINDSNDDEKMRCYCELISAKRPLSIARNVFINCSHNDGCNQAQLGRLMQGDEGRVVFSISGDNKKSTGIRKSGISLRCPKCDCLTYGNWHNIFRKFWEALLPDTILKDLKRDRCEKTDNDVVIGDG